MDRNTIRRAVLSWEGNAKKGLFKPVLLFAFVVGLLAALGVACQPAPLIRPAAAAPHPALDAKPAKPKRLEAEAQINMAEMYFANPKGEKNPTFRVPAGKTVGIHIHNEGEIMHEFAIGRKLKADKTGYEEVLTEMVPMDVFFYYGTEKAELEGATFGEVEVDKGIKEIWIRATFPEKYKGEWEIGCFVEGHYEAGMHSKLIIE